VELSLLPARTPQQEEQLKTLVLERDFERRAQEEENEEENDIQYQKNSSAIQEVLRLQPSQINTPTTRLKQVDIKTTPTNISPPADVPPMSMENAQLPPPIQPKSILKSTYNSNPSSPSKHGKVTSFASQIDTKNHNLTEITMNNTNANLMLTQLGKEMNELTIDYQMNDGGMPPPPPERGSSFAVMNQQKLRNSGTFQKLSFNEHPIINNNNSKYSASAEHSPLMSPTGAGSFTAHQIQQQMNIINNNVAFVRDNKRVSFHDHENNNVGEGGVDHDLSIIREDPNVSILISKKNVDQNLGINKVILISGLNIIKTLIS
jgi:afadin